MLDDLFGSGRLAVVVAHPDDEVVGAGALLLERRPDLLIWTTDGAPRDPGDARHAGCATRDEYAALRRAERDRVADLLGVPRYDRLECGCVDQEAALALTGLAERLADLLRASNVAVVLTHPYEGGHPDHDATAFAVHAARALLARDAGQDLRIVELTSYHAAPAQGAWIESGRFLPHRNREWVLALDQARCARKCALYGCYETQQRVLEGLPLVDERFRVAPAYDFTVPPHAGQLHYERYDWGMTAERWCGLAADALEALAGRAEVPA